VESAPVPRFPRLSGAAVAAFGLLVIASWYAQWRAILQIVPGSAPMQYNTALCFVLSGAGLFLLTTRRLRPAGAPDASRVHRRLEPQD
jgi:hypothetical protein